MTFVSSAKEKDAVDYYAELCNMCITPLPGKLSVQTGCSSLSVSCMLCVSQHYCYICFDKSILNILSYADCQCFDAVCSLTGRASGLL